MIHQVISDIRPTRAHEVSPLIEKYLNISLYGYCSHEKDMQASE